MKIWREFVKARREINEREGKTEETDRDEGRGWGELER